MATKEKQLSIFRIIFLVTGKYICSFFLAEITQFLPPSKFPCEKKVASQQTHHPNLHTLNTIWERAWGLCRGESNKQNLTPQQVNLKKYPLPTLGLG